MDEYRQTDIETDSLNDFIVDISTFQCFSESTTYVALQDRTILKHLVHTHTHTLLKKVASVVMVIVQQYSRCVL